MKTKNAPASKSQITSRVVSRTAKVNAEIGFMLNFAADNYQIGFELELVKVFEAEGKKVFKRLDFIPGKKIRELEHLPADTRELLHSLTSNGLMHHLKNDGFAYLFNYEFPWNYLTDNAKKSLKKYYIAQMRQLWPWLSRHKNVYWIKNETFSNKNVIKAVLAPDLAQIGFRAIEKDKNIEIRLEQVIGGTLVAAKNTHIYGDEIIEIDGVLHLPEIAPDGETAKQFEHGYMKVPVTSRERVIKTIIPQLLRNYKVEAPASLLAESVQVIPVPQVFFREMDGKFLIVQPRFDYNGSVVNYDTNPENIIQTTPGGLLVIIERNTAVEKAFFESTRRLHPKFEKPTMNNFFFLPFEDTMKRNWFIDTVSGLKDNNIAITGIEALKTHRFNTNKAKLEVTAGIGIDWFDVQIEISFGDQIVPLQGLRRALSTGQNMVTLADGSVGILPVGMLQQYEPLMKLGDEQKDGRLRISKLHYTLLDQLPESERNAAVRQEIEEKKERLKLIGSIKSVLPSNIVKAELRPYQLSGFQWLHTLDELGWGGCLADDMGLGKTLQAITFLQYLKEKYKGSTHLVVCPTSLIYNWESELQKFCPSLKYHIYYGNEREFREEHYAAYDVIITSYGTIRNDLDQLFLFDWHYVFLDESQAIKNPGSLTTRALQLLKSKNRIILSGTPVQNNTFDLFAQFNFINPGLLGTRDFFKTEFATPIDKGGDAGKSALLRKMIYPFLLRRTKEQVAPDLPDKTEMVIWCHMEPEQMAVYNQYKSYYRDYLLDKIEDVGIGQSGIYVLEGLLRLRQICDSPALLKNNEVTTTQSVKTDELMREIEENAGGHKLLVFSQFTEMLHLLEARLQSDGVPYTYLDGSTPAAKRQAAVNKFQNDPAIRVFLISLKAGGVGLNLTAADYVYIVDPWWNPAAEAQAIDRTHRIGQVNKVFAYKMICKGTVEEKILLLQQKKKQLAADLISEDAAFVKNLTKDDVAYLFS